MSATATSWQLPTGPPQDPGVLKRYGARTTNSPSSAAESQTETRTFAGGVKYP